jgi:pimeloyl-ACP methyl ester carboxylesterase
MKPTVDALARRCRVITFSLADEPTSGARLDEAKGFWSYVDQIDEAMALAGVRQAAVCGVSYGGLVAAAFAARHPDRVSSLILVSALPPRWRPDARARVYLKAPRLLAPLFFIRSLFLYREIAAAHGGLLKGLLPAARHGVTVLRHMLSPSRMARRVRLLAAANLAGTVTRLDMPTLLITGEDGLDRVVPPHLTREYLTICPDAASVTLARTGHLGLITRPDDFAHIVATFVDASAPENRRRIG